MALPDEILAALRSLLVSAAQQPGAEALQVAGATAAEFAQLRFGGPTRIQITHRSVGVVAQRALDNNPRRIGWIAINQSSAAVVISTDPAVTTTTGIPMQGSGGAVSMQVDEDGESVAWEWFAISAATGQGVSVFEFLRV